MTSESETTIRYGECGSEMMAVGGRESWKTNTTNTISITKTIAGVGTNSSANSSATATAGSTASSTAVTAVLRLMTITATSAYGARGARGTRKIVMDNVMGTGITVDTTVELFLMTWVVWAMVVELMMVAMVSVGASVPVIRGHAFGMKVHF